MLDAIVRQYLRLCSRRVWTLDIVEYVYSMVWTARCWKLQFTCVEIDIRIYEKSVTRISAMMERSRQPITATEPPRDYAALCNYKRLKTRQVAVKFAATH